MSQPASDLVAPAVKTTCPYCGVGCGVLATPDGQGGVAIAGDPEHPANFGRLCSKGSALGETVDLGDRLLSPRVDGKTVTWEGALGAVAGGLRRIAEQHGPPTPSPAPARTSSAASRTSSTSTRRSCSSPV